MLQIESSILAHKVLLISKLVGSLRKTKREDMAIL